MSHITSNLFSSYQLTEAEERAGSLLTQQNIEFFHNQRTRIAEQKNSLAIDPANIQGYIQQEAYLRGQIDSITWILELAANAAQESYELAQELAVTELHDSNISPSSLIFGNT